MGDTPLRLVMRDAWRSTQKLGTAPAPPAEEDPSIALRRFRIHESGILLGRGDDEMIATATCQVTPALDALRSWSTPVLILCGSIGTGKTFAAAMAIADRGHARAVKSPRLARAVDPWTVDVANGAVPLDLRAPLIVLDDLGTEAPDARWCDAFATLVEHRQMHGRTIITTNIRAKDLRERYDERVIDRLDAMATAVELGGESLRGTGGGLKEERNAD